MFLAYLVSAILQVRILGGEQKKWHQDRATVYERMSAKRDWGHVVSVCAGGVRVSLRQVHLMMDIFHIQLENNYEWPFSSKLTACSFSNRFNLEGIGPDPECVYESEQRYPLI